jgi:hypothetical protein
VSGAVCRFCAAPLEETFVDLGWQPLANGYLRPDEVASERFYPLHAYVCSRCLLVQVGEVVSPGELFGSYAYFSSYAESWLQHARGYADTAVQRFGLDARHLVVEIGSNDGYLLQYFRDKGIPILGVEAAANVAEVAVDRGIPTVCAFFGAKVAERLVADGYGADLLVGNNVLGHVPDLNDFVSGLERLLNSGGVLTMEFPHLLRLVAESQFDTVYHEHFSYFSLVTASRVFQAHGLRVFDVEELTTHGGSLRVYVCHAADPTRPTNARVAALEHHEADAGLTRLDRYRAFRAQAERTRQKLRGFLHAARAVGRSVVGYGAPAKGNVLLNFCAVDPGLVAYTVDRSPHKQGRLLPGTHLPIYPPERINETRPDYVLILPWNLKEEIIRQMACVREWGGRFVIPIPELAVLA